MLLPLLLLTVTPTISTAELAQQTKTQQQEWKQEPLAPASPSPALASLVVVTLRTKGQNVWLVRGKRAAPFSVEGGCALLAPLDAATAQAVVDVVEAGVDVGVQSIERLAAAGFTVAPPPAGKAATTPFSFVRVQLRHADSAPEVVQVRLDIAVDGTVTRSEHVIARPDVAVPASSAPAQKADAVSEDRAELLQRFVAAAARG